MTAASPEPTPKPEYTLEPIDWPRASDAFREFFHHYFVDAVGLGRGEVDFAFLERMRPEELELARRLLRRNLALNRVHIIDGLAELGDRSAVPELRSMLARERDLSRRLTLGRVLWRLDRDPAFAALLEEMVRSGWADLRIAHFGDVALLGDERAVRLYVRLLDDRDRLVRSLALKQLNGLELRRQFLIRADQLPHQAKYYRARLADAVFLGSLAAALREDRRSWPPVWEP